MMPLTYLHELRCFALGTLTSWRHFPGPLRDAWRALGDLFYALIGLIGILLGPLLFPLVPVFAFLSLRSRRKALAEDQRDRERMRANIHRNGRQP